MKKFLTLVLAFFLTVSPTYAATNSAKFVGASAQFVSAADSASLDVSGDLTIEGWYKFASLPTGDAATLESKWVDAGNQHSYLLELFDNSGTWTIRLLNSDTGSAVGLATVNWTPSTSTWYHVAVVFTASTHTMELFINGVSQGTATGTLKTSEFNSTAISTIGTNNTTSQPLDGQAFLVRVWSATRTGSQLSTNQCTLLGSTSNLKAEWSLDNVLTDNSGNSNTLTNHSSTFTADVPSACASVASVSPRQFHAIWWQ